MIKWYHKICLVISQNRISDIIKYEQISDTTNWISDIIKYVGFANIAIFTL